MTSTSLSLCRLRCQAFAGHFRRRFGGQAKAPLPVDSQSAAFDNLLHKIQPSNGRSILDLGAAPRAPIAERGYIYTLDGPEAAAAQHIRSSSLFPDQIQESNVRAILDRVEYIEAYSAESHKSIMDRLIAKAKRKQPRDSAPFNAVDLGAITRQHNRWTSLLPRVHPFYAVKCNPDPTIVTLLDALGASFDCASQREFELLLANDIDVTDKVVFSHPCKHPLHLEFARQIGVDLCTFDNEWEIAKIARHHPRCQALLRIQVDDSQSKLRFNEKYGLNVESHSEVCRIFELCRRHDIDLKGIMFHVGSGCRDRSVYGAAIEQCKFLFDMAHAQFGYDPSEMNTLDLGGGYPGLEPGDPVEDAEGGSGKPQSTFEEIAQQINESLDHHFGDDESSDYRFIAEPGRFYVANSHSLVCEVIAKKKRADGSGFAYYLNDGIYGAFNNILYEQAQPQLLPHQKTLQRRDEECEDEDEDAEQGEGDKDSEEGEEVLYPSTIFGPTCDCIDKLYDDYPLRELEIMDKVVVPNVGAYTSSLATGFNGFEPPKPCYVMTL